MHASPSAGRGQSRRILLLGATGTIGRAVARSLAHRGHEVICLVRATTEKSSSASSSDLKSSFAGCAVRQGSVTDPASLLRDGFKDERFDAVISCLASRTGVPDDAWAVDHQANLNALDAARRSGVGHFILLSAICVQKPVLAFQQAKLAFEKCLIGSGLTYSIVRPTAFFKSLSGQIQRLKRGKPFLVFGDGTQTACKPISDEDLANFISDCLEDESRWNTILPIGGPGNAITPRQQGEYLCGLLGREPHIRQVSVRLLDAIILLLSSLSRVFPGLAAKAELARIGRYYATESMLVWNPETAGYDAQLTPSTGSDTLFEFYERLMKGEPAPERGDHAVF